MSNKDQLKQQYDSLISQAESISAELSAIATEEGKDYWGEMFYTPEEGEY